LLVTKKDMGAGWASAAPESAASVEVMSASFMRPPSGAGGRRSTAL
jgi:hypothetical protein